MAEISAELDSLACELIGAAIDMIETETNPPVMLATDCEDDMVSFEGDTPDSCYRAASEHIAGLGKACTRYALLACAIVARDERDPGSDALVVEFAQRGMEHAWSGYLLYRRDDDGRLEVDDPLPAGEEPLLFG